jgi:hypothetical protein
MFDIHEALLPRAGVPSEYDPQCANSGPTGRCVGPMLGVTVNALTMTCIQYDDNVVGSGSPKYDEAYFEINYVRAYTTGGPAPTASPSSRWVYGNGSNTAMRLPAPTCVFSSAMSSANASPNAVAGGVDVAMSYQLVQVSWP